MKNKPMLFVVLLFVMAIVVSVVAAVSGPTYHGNFFGYFEGDGSGLTNISGTTLPSYVLTNGGNISVKGILNDPGSGTTNNGVGFFGNGGGLTNIVSTIDTRPMTNYDLKSSPCVNLVPKVLMTQTGPGTITLLHLGFQGSTNVWTYPNALVEIIIDGVTNSCRLYSLFNSWGDNYGFRNGWADGLADINRDTYGGNRSEQINFYQSAQVQITFSNAPTGSFPINAYTDVNVLTGPPVHNGVFSHWHCSEAQGVLAPLAFLPSFSTSGGPGRISSVEWFACSTNPGTAGQGYLEHQPSFIIDGTTVVMANGSEDFVSSWGYFQDGKEVIWQQRWGCASEFWLYDAIGGDGGFPWAPGVVYPNLHASILYRNFTDFAAPQSQNYSGFCFSNSASFGITNVFGTVTGQYTSNILLSTWTTAN